MTDVRYGELEAAQIIRFGKTHHGTQHYRGKCCGQTFTETYGTVFYRRQAARKTTLETLALLTEGGTHQQHCVRQRDQGRHDSRLVACSGSQAEEVEEAPLKDYRISQAQMDGLWTYVDHKGQKAGTPKKTTR